MICYIVLIVATSGIYAQGVDDQRRPLKRVKPALYIDGQRLAERVMHLVLDGEQGSVNPYSPKVERVSKLLSHLKHGKPITKDPDWFRKRDAMQHWVAQQRHQVKPHELYAEAFRREGNIQNGLILLWNALSDRWIDYAREGEFNRNNLAHTRNLMDLTGERPFFEGTNKITHHQIKDKAHKLEADSKGTRKPNGGSSTHRSKTIRGDNFSAWYHFAGTALLSYSLAGQLPLGTKWIGKKIAYGAVFLEEFVYFNEHIDGQKRNQIDLAGARFGANLANIARNYRVTADFRNYLSNKKEFKKYMYMDLQKVGGQNYLLGAGQRSGDYLNREKLLSKCSRGFLDYFLR
jgi:hypothetical protein